MAAPAHNYADAFVADIPCIVKAKDIDGKRMIEVQASSEAVDAEGDVIAQGALLGSAAEFIKSGHLDIDHISELGPRMGIANPESYIIGRPTEVKDMGSGKTSVIGEIRRATNGVHNPNINKFDAFWDSMQSDPPILWRASVYGFPKGGMVDDCREVACSSGAKRFHIKGMSWRSLALTRNPVNESLTGFAKILKASTYIELFKAANTMTPPDIRPFDGGGAGPCVGEPCDAPLANSFMGGPAGAAIAMSEPRNLMDALGQYHAHMRSDCAHTEGMNTTAGFKAHFQICCGMSADMADLYAHALMHKILLHRRRV